MTKIRYDVRTPAIELLEPVLNQLADEGWSVMKISEPLARRSGIYVMVVGMKFVDEEPNDEQEDKHPSTDR